MFSKFHQFAVTKPLLRTLPVRGMTKRSFSIGSCSLNSMSMSNNHSSLISDIESSIPFNIETANQSQPLHEAVQSQLNTGNQLNAIDIALNAEQPITTWTKEQISEIYNTPLNDLLFFSQVQHRKYHNSGKIQLCTLLSIKTGGCSEDCSYCAQSSKHDTGLKAEKLIDVETVFQKAKEAKLNGSTRFCMGSAWRDMTGRKSALKKISTMVSRINNELGLETCVTLGMINKEQAKTLADAGLTAYNHNIDTSREHYPNVITTRSYDDRLNTIKTVQNTEKIKVCTGGILGLGETKEDHVSFLYTLSNMDQHPESLPINRLVPIKGTPIEKELSSGKLPKERKLTFEAILKVIATARLIMPKSIIRLAAGRYTMKESEQLLCFMTGCNAIFTGERMLTTMCSGWEDDIAMLSKWGFTPMKSFEKH